MKNVAIRPARPEDLERLCELLGELFTIECDFKADSGRQRRGLALLMETEDAVVLVAEREARVVGMCSVQTLVSTAEGDLVGLLEDFVVEEASRGRGIGSKLVDEACLWAGRRGLSRLQLLVDRGNPPALTFYRNKGWRNTELICLRKKPL